MNPLGIAGWELTQAIWVMVQATFQAGNRPVKVVMHPTDFDAMRDEDGKPWTLLSIAGLPIEIDANCEPGKITALNARPLSNTASD